MKKGELALLALVLDAHRIKQNQEIDRLRAENDRLRQAVGSYRLIENIKRG